MHIMHYLIILISLITRESSTLSSFIELQTNRQTTKGFKEDKEEDKEERDEYEDDDDEEERRNSCYYFE